MGVFGEPLIPQKFGVSLFRFDSVIVRIHYGSANLNANVIGWQPKQRALNPN